MFNFITDAVTGVLRGGKEVAEVFKENEENKGERESSENISTKMQFAAEFVDRQNRTRFDSFVDGLNRLPRPLISLSVLCFFIIAPFYPDELLKLAYVYSTMPDGFWVLLSIVIGFYFGGRMQIKAQNFKQRKNLQGK